MRYRHRQTAQPRKTTDAGVSPTECPGSSIGFAGKDLFRYFWRKILKLSDMMRINRSALVSAVLSLIFCTLPSCSSDEEEELVGNWVKVSDFDGVARCSAVTFTVDGTVYIATGGYGGYKYRLRRRQDVCRRIRDGQVRICWTRV